MNRTDVQLTLREMWETRPPRPREDRQIAGVAAALARRYDIDPVLVRIGFVVAAFYGIGVALYIAGWVLLPDQGKHPGPSIGTEPGAGRTPVTRSSPRPLLLVGLAVAAALSLGELFDGGFPLLPAAAAAGLLFLLHRSRAHRGTGPSAPVGGHAPVTTATPAAAGTPSGGQVQPPAWDPLGAAPFAWDLPEPSPAPQPAPHRRRSPVTAVTLATALLAGGVTGIIMLAGGGLADLPVLFGVLLGVLGAGLVVGAFLRAGRGLIPVALLVGALTWATLAAPLDRWDGRSPDIRFAPISAETVAPVYEQDVGSLELDLRGVDLTAPLGQSVTPLQTELRVGFGQVQVLVPPDADVTFRGSAGLGAVLFDDRESAGPGAELTVADDLGADGVRSGRPLVLDVQAGAGAVEVRRG